MILNKKQISQKLKNKDIEISDFKEENLKETSYTLILGNIFNNKNNNKSLFKNGIYKLVLLGSNFCESDTNSKIIFKIKNSSNKTFLLKKPYICKSYF